MLRLQFFRFLSLLISPSPVNIRRKARRKPWMAKAKSRLDRKRSNFSGVEHSSTNPLYKTARWKAVREGVLSRYPLCYWCQGIGRVTEATDADHVQPSSGLDDSQFFDPNTLVGSSRSCNSRRASYTAKGVSLETKEQWAEYLRQKSIGKFFGL